jgi:cold shock CspA family protein
MPHSEAIEHAIRERAEKLDRFSDLIMGCRVMVESRHRRHSQGKLYHIRVDLTAPGEEIVVSREHALHHAHEDVYVSIRDAFDAAQRRLEDYARRRRQQVKAHDTAPRGRIRRLETGKGFGFIETPDGREIYFHRNSVVNTDFDRLEAGDVVRFHEEAGQKGLQASTVRLEKSRASAGPDPYQEKREEEGMDLREIRKIAKTMGIQTKGMDKAELIHAIQLAEGNFDCYGTAVEETCDQESCLWRQDCFVESTAVKKAV